MAHLHGKNAKWNDSHWLFDWGTLAQLYTITYNNRVEAHNVGYIKKLQDKTRFERPAALLAWLKLIQKTEGN